MTVEDIIEEIVGEIADETDPAGNVRRLANGDWYVRGELPITDLVDYGIDLEVDSDAYNSVGGFVFGELGRLPKRGDMVHANGYSLRVESVRENRIEAVRIRDHEPARRAKERSNAGRVRPRRRLGCPGKSPCRRSCRMWSLEVNDSQRDALRMLIRAQGETGPSLSGALEALDLARWDDLPDASLPWPELEKLAAEQGVAEADVFWDLACGMKVTRRLRPRPRAVARSACAEPQTRPPARGWSRRAS